MVSLKSPSITSGGLALTGNRVRLDEMDFSGRLLKPAPEEEEPKKPTVVGRVIDSLRN